jgi:hypothetical protein
MKTRRVFLSFFYIVGFLSIVICCEVSFALDKDMNSPLSTPDEKIPELSPKDDIKKYKKITPKIMEQADLIVYRLHINNYLTDDESRKIELTVYVKNQGRKSTSSSLTPEGLANSSDGYFKVLVEWTDDAERGIFNRLCERGYGSLDAGGISHAPCKDTVPRGTIRKYRVTVDSLNWIDESNEENNVTARAFESR